MGDLGVTHRVHLWLDGRRVVGFLLVLIEFMAAALLSEYLSKSPFSEGVGHFERKCLVDGDVARNPSMDR